LFTNYFEIRLLELEKRVVAAQARPLWVNPV
jgi:hypothetical protein